MSDLEDYSNEDALSWFLDEVSKMNLADLSSFDRTVLWLICSLLLGYGPSFDPQNKITADLTLDFKVVLANLAEQLNDSDPAQAKFWISKIARGEAKYGEAKGFVKLMPVEAKAPELDGIVSLSSDRKIELRMPMEHSLLMLIEQSTPEGMRGDPEVVLNDSGKLFLSQLHDHIGVIERDKATYTASRPKLGEDMRQEIKDFDVRDLKHAGMFGDRGSDAAVNVSKEVSNDSLEESFLDLGEESTEEVSDSWDESSVNSEEDSTDEKSTDEESTEEEVVKEGSKKIGNP